MSKKTPRCSVEDQAELGPPPAARQVDRPKKSPGKAEAAQRNGETTSTTTTSSSPESGSLNGDGKRGGGGGKSRRRRKRSSNAESRAEEEENGDGSKRGERAPAPGAGLVGLRSECANVWFERSAYERAEGLYQRRLANPSNGTAKSSRPACRHGDQVACHHVAGAVGVNKATFDQAEGRFVEGASPPSVPNSLDLAAPPSRRSAPTPATPDEGYQSSAPTPATPAARQSVNGLPRIPAELLRDVWLEKPLYDRAEAAFYQNLYGNNASKRPGGSCASRCSDHPQSLVEEEEEEEEGEGEEEEAAVAAGGEARAVPQGKAEVFHALHPIQEEEEPVEVPEKEEASASGVQFFLHPQSERVWADKWRYDAAESRFHGRRGDKAAAKKKRRPEASPAAAAAPPRDKKMSSADFLAQEKIWFDKPRYDAAERRFYERVTGSPQATPNVGANSILQDIARARENIQKSLAGLKTSLSHRGSASAPPPLSHLSHINAAAGPSNGGEQGELISRISSLELENQSLYKVVDDLRAALSKLECRVCVLEKSPAAASPARPPAAPHTNGTAMQQKISAPIPEDEDEDDDDLDLFGSDEDDEAEKLKEQRLKEYAEKKSKKPALIAKSSILLDVKPWDDETDMARLEECVRSVQADGLLWGTSKLVAVGYGIKKLQIACVVEDDKVGTDLLEEEITKFEDFVQSVDVAAFNKI